MPNTLFHLQFEEPFTIKQTALASIIESSDLWTKTTSAGGSISWGDSYVELDSNTTLNGTAFIVKRPSAPPFKAAWNKRRIMRFGAEIRHANDPNSLIYIGTGEIYPNAYGFGIKAENNKIIGISANGGAPAALDLVTGLTPLWTENHLYEIIFTPGSNLEFFLDGVSKGKITTNLPTGVSGSHVPFKAHCKTGTGGVGHYIILSGYMFVIE